jgi:pimeloyl-ACP methyl ester carboxylesterase
MNKLEFIEYAGEHTHKVPILALPGATLTAQIFHNAGEVYSENGYPFYALNYSGHGNSTGKNHNLGDFIRDTKQAYDQISEKYQRPPAIMTNSLAAEYAYGLLENCPAAILITPVLSVKDSIKTFMWLLKSNRGMLAAASDPNKWTNDIKRESFFTIDTPEQAVIDLKVNAVPPLLFFGAMLHKFRMNTPINIPVLGQFSKYDNFSTEYSMKRFGELFPNSQILKYELGHLPMLDANGKLRWNKVVLDAIAWMNRIMNYEP